MALTDEKLERMVEDVAVTRSKIEDHTKAIETLSIKVGDLSEKVGSLTSEVGHIKEQWDEDKEDRRSLARTSDVSALKVQVESVESTLDDHCKSGLAGNLSVKDWKHIIKILALIVGMLVVGSAGGQGLSTLVKMLLELIVTFGQ